MVFAWIFAGIVIFLLLIVIFYYNRFVTLENRIDNSLSQIDVQLKKRSDLVPNLLSAVKGYMKHEKSIMADVTEARRHIMSAKTLPERAKAGAELQNAFRSLFAIAENYPTLKANENFIQLQNELSAIEERIAYSRQYYNDSILSYNNTVESFPGVMFAKMFNKHEKPMLQIAAEERAVPKVEF